MTDGRLLRRDRSDHLEQPLRQLIKLLFFIT
jgi:hypothetical protein